MVEHFATWRRPAYWRTSIVWILKLALGIETSPNNWLWPTGSLCCPEKQISRVFVTFQELFAKTIINGETSLFKSLAKHRTQTRTKPNLSCNFSSLFFRSIVYLEPQHTVCCCIVFVQMSNHEIVRGSIASTMLVWRVFKKHRYLMRFNHLKKFQG